MIFQNRTLLFAFIIGLGMHGALFIGMAKYSLGAKPSNLFQLRMQQEEEKMRTSKVERSNNDLIINKDDPSPFKDSSTNNLSAKNDTPLPSQVNDLLNQLRVDMKELPKSTDPSSKVDNPTTKPGVAKLTGDKPNVAAPAAKPQITKSMLAMTRPNLDLPRFVPSSDAVAVPLPNTIFFQPGQAITQDIKDIDKVLENNNPGTPNNNTLPGTGPGNNTGDKKPMIKENSDTVNKIVNKPVTPLVKPEPKPIVPIVKPKPEPPKPVLIPKLPNIVTQLPKINPPKQNKPTVHLDEDFTYSLHTYRGEVNKKLFDFGNNDIQKEGWFEVRIAPKTTLNRLKPLKKDVVYVIDTSGSINARWLEETRKGISMSLDSLNEGDRFNIMMFKENVTLLDSDKPVVENTIENKKAAREFLDAAKTSGWTDVNQALSRLIVHHTAPDRVYQIILVSDGVPTRGAIDPKRIINMITRENSRVAGIYCVGIGSRIDRELLDFLAYRNKGTVIYPKSYSTAAAEIRELSGRIRFPIVKDARFNLVGVNHENVYPQIDRDIYLGDTISYYGRFDKESLLSMRLNGTNADEFLDMTFTLKFNNNDYQRGTESTAKTWAFWKLHHLYSEIARQGKTPALMAEINKIKEIYGINAAY